MWILRRSMPVVSALVAAAIVGTGVTAPPAHAADPCGWDPGHYKLRSQCDGVSANDSRFACSRDGITKHVRYIRGNATDGGIRVSLYYSRACRTVWALMESTFSIPDGSNCYVKVERNYGNPRPVHYAGMVNREGGWAFAETAMLYDADVTSYAWGYCKIGNTVHSGGTPSY